MYWLRVAFIVMLVPILVIVDAAVYSYLGRLPGHIVSIGSVVVAIIAIAWGMRISDEDADPMYADRHPHG
jgi:hypothetical protein